MHAYRGYKYCEFVVHYEEMNIDGLFDVKKPLWIPKQKYFDGIRSALNFIKKKGLGCFVRLAFVHEENMGKPSRSEETVICDRKTMLEESPDFGFEFDDIRRKALPVSVHVTAKRDKQLDEWRYYENEDRAEKEIRAQKLSHDAFFVNKDKYDSLLVDEA